MSKTDSGKNVPLESVGKTNQLYCKWGRQQDIMRCSELRQKLREVWIKHMREQEKSKSKPFLYAISPQPSLLLPSVVKTFSFLRLLLRTNRSLLFHPITSEHTWSFWLRFWYSCLWDNCSIYPEYFSLPISSKTCPMLALPPLQLSAFLFLWNIG